MTDPTEAGRTVADLSESLYAQGTTDGLPVIPPTDELVDEMLRGTDTPRDEVLGELGNNDNPLTVEQLASNAVMAGCVPPYMPVLEAGAKALADPDSNSIQFSVSTGSWAYQWLVNGPVRDALEIQSSSNAFGPYFRANRTIARALGMAYRNVTRIHPGEKDMGTIGNPGKFSTLAGENEEASPWEPYHVSRGYDAEESTITLAGPNSWIQWVPTENTAEHVLRGMIRNTPSSMRAITREELDVTIFHAVNPYNAEELERADLSRAAVEEYLVENSHTTQNAYSRTFMEPDLGPRQIRQYHDTDAVSVACVGGPGRVNAIIGSALGAPVTKKIEFPDGWESLVEEYSVEREWVPTEGFYD